MLSALFLFMVPLISPMVLALLLPSAGKELELLPLTTSIPPIFVSFSIATLIALAFVSRVNLPLTQRIQKQVFTLGYVEDNQSSLFSSFGFSVVLWVLVASNFIGDYVCQKIAFKDTTIDISHVIPNYLNCQVWNYSAIAFIAGIGLGYFLWVFFQVRLIEKETKQTIFVHHYKTREWSLWTIPIAAIIIFVIGFAFYQIFTLGAQ